MSEFNAVYVTRNIVSDFLESDNSVMVIESCASGHNESPMHKRLRSLFRNYANAKATAPTVGDIRSSYVGRKRILVDMYLTDSYVSRGVLNEEAIKNALDKILDLCRAKAVDPSNVMLSRLYGGKRAVPLPQVMSVIDSWCNENQIKLKVYVNVGK